MKKKETIWVIIGLFTLVGSVAQATPSLQLDILGGTYDLATETTVSNGDSFDLYAYLIADSVDPTATYYISAALTPAVAEGDEDYGSFVFNDTTVEVTADMEYGIPPLDLLYPDLPSHEIYDTFYREFAFTFEESNMAAVINVEDGPGADLDTSGTEMYYTSFTIDTSGLDDGYEIHFDLYNLYTRNDKLFITSAPFSHDAESRGSSPVPEPATMLLFGTGLVGLAGAVHRMKNKK